jgi:hypothetical protein
MRLKIPTSAHTIRFPGDLYEKIHILAGQSGRTFNGAVVYLLQIGFAVAKRYDESVSKIIQEETNVQEVDEGNE